MEKTTTLYRLSNGEPVELEADHAKRVLDYEKKRGLTAHSAKKPEATPDDETKRPAGNPDGNESRQSEGAQAGAAG